MYGTDGGGEYAYHQKIFLRQGEGADYLMHPDDSDGYDNQYMPRNTTFTRKFSVYNLTSSGITDEYPNYHYQMSDAREGIMTDYPSKAGAFFQFAMTDEAYQRIAYHPVYGGGPHNTSPAGVWDDGQETCPPGYRRPIATSGIPDNEFSYSLSSDMFSNLSNAVWGYYADGYFDRREITVSGDNVPDSAVSPYTKEVAYVGKLIFNPQQGGKKYNASLFFPAAGYRYVVGNSLANAGGNGFYWSSSIFGSNTGCWLNLYNGSEFPYHDWSRSFGMSVRCVVE